MHAATTPFLFTAFILHPFIIPHCDWNEAPQLQHHHHRRRRRRHPPTFFSRSIQGDLSAFIFFLRLFCFWQHGTAMCFFFPFPHTFWHPVSVSVGVSGAFKE
jgi:hypothetical protein